jgi:general secretion pathway protein J
MPYSNAIRLILQSGIRRQARGFTLLELLVAMGIFAVIGAMALGGLNTVVDQTTIAREQMDRLARLQRALRLMSGDFSNLVPRVVRDELGSAGEAPLLADGRLFGVEPPQPRWLAQSAGLPHRGTLQRVQYRLDDDKLIREYWQVMDHVLGQEPRSEELLSGVNDFKLFYLDAQDEWQTQWPPAQATSAVDGQRPRAVRIVLDLQDWGAVERLIEVSQ